MILKMQDFQLKTFYRNILDFLWRIKSFSLNTNWSLNLSSRNFSNAELDILDRGLNFALGKSTVDTSKLLASLEPAISKLNCKDKHVIRTGIVKIISKRKK